MGDDIRLGRIAGVPVGASWSLLVILALLAWTLGAAVLPAAAPGAHAAIYWPVAVVTAVAFLACLLAHELAHALVARRRDVEVEGITLWMFGGISRLRGDAHDARTERRVALAGPVASVVLGVGFTAVALLLRRGAGARVRRRRDVPAEARATTSLAEVAVPLDQVVTARPGDQLLDLLAPFTPGSGRRAVVLEDGRLVGIVTARDIDRMLEVAGVEVTPGHLVRTR
jgi:Zn-dependent protease